MKRIKEPSTTIKSSTSMKRVLASTPESINLLPVATSQYVGGVKIGSGVNVASDGTISVSGGGTTISPGNPTASVGLAEVNGTAATYMRSDAAPKLDQSISPTWTGAHTYSGSIIVPTQTKGDNSTKAASTAFVTSAIAGITPVSGANPSAKVGTQAVNGTATTYMRSDAAPVLDLSMSPTWTGAHTYSGSISVPTQNAGDSSTKAASTSFVSSAVQTAVAGIPKLQPATASLLGGVKIGSGINVQTDGTISVSGSAILSPANPSAKVGLTTVDGTATTYMRSDAAPALDQSISPSWTGTHAFNSTVTVPTKTAGDNTTNAASTAFVTGAVQTAIAGIPKLQPATATLLGGVKIGSGITVQTDGTISVSSSQSVSPGNPTATVGLTAVDGSATTYMRSDAAPALDQTMSPTWSGTHTFSGSIYVPTAAQSDNSTKAASTAFVASAIASIPQAEPATTQSLGVVQIGDNINVQNGVISVAAPYSLPIASQSVLGGVKIGSNINVASDGTISVATPTARVTSIVERNGVNNTYTIKTPVTRLITLWGNNITFNMPVRDFDANLDLSDLKIIVFVGENDSEGSGTTVTITINPNTDPQEQVIPNGVFTLNKSDPEQQQKEPYVINLIDRYYAYYGASAGGPWFVTSGYFLG